MRKVATILIMLMALFASRAEARLNVVCSYPWITDLTAKVGGERVKALSLSQGNWNPHLVVPRPSLIGKARDADLLIMNGAQLEIGWLPPIVRESRNPRIQQGLNGLLDISSSVTLIEVPIAVSRAGGDVHPDGNPHYALDPHNIAPIAAAIASRLALLDPEGAAVYEAKLLAFRTDWNKRLAGLDTRFAALRGVKVVSYHTLFNYLARRYGMILVGTIEPFPGIPPTSRHIESLIGRSRAEGLELVLQDVYNPSKPARMLAEKTGARLVVLPHDIGAVPEAKDLYALFETIAGRLGR
ncbi:MAG TPA: zinc ABC transporter substrate-binding protein [Spirochaetota bacterium]|nr:zinc ABC transporter substrate-binding protein [Spirochaetota bacterium]